MCPCLVVFVECSGSDVVDEFGPGGVAEGEVAGGWVLGVAEGDSVGMGAGFEAVAAAGVAVGAFPQGGGLVGWC